MISVAPHSVRGSDARPDQPGMSLVRVPLRTDLGDAVARLEAIQAYTSSDSDHRAGGWRA